MYSTQFLPLLRNHFKLTRHTGCLPFEFDPQSGKVVVTKSRIRVRFSQLQFVTTVIYWLVLLQHFCFGPVTMLKRLQGFLFVVGYPIFLAAGWDVGLDIAPVQIINSILAFEKGLVEGTYAILY